MMFLLRMTFWLGLVLVLLPRDGTGPASEQTSIDPADAMSAAGAAFSDMTKFCARQPAACEVGGQAATAIGNRAQEGAKKLYRIITDKKAPEHTGSIVVEANGVPLRDTLTTEDRDSAWSVPAAQ